MGSVGHLIDRINSGIGKTVSLLSILLVAVIVVDVFLRYFFSITSVASAELEWHLFAAIFMLSAGWTLHKDRHVRVDLFYQHLSEKKKALVDLIGTLVLLLPFCFVGFSESLSFVSSSFAVGETSPDPGGLPARYIIKSATPIGFLLIGLQGVSIVLKKINCLLGDDKSYRQTDAKG